MPGKTSRRQMWIAGISAVVCVLAVVGWSVGRDWLRQRAMEHAPSSSVTSCSNDGILARLGYQVTNRDTVAHDYYVTGTYGHTPLLPGVLKNVKPGETARGELVGGSSETGSCALTAVDQQ